jgi:hypothetical protein
MNLPLLSDSRFWLLGLLSCLLAGCGHPATTQECEEIIDRIVEFELKQQNVTDPKVIAERKAARRKSQGDEMLKKCVGRRITDRSMTCIRQADSQTQIENVCLR